MSDRNQNFKVACVTITIAKPGFEDSLQTALEHLALAVQKEIGFLQYDLHRDLDEPRRFFAIENWESRSDFDNHCNAPHVLRYREQVSDMIEYTAFHPMSKL